MEALPDPDLTQSLLNLGRCHRPCRGAFSCGQACAACFLSPKLRIPGRQRHPTRTTSSGSIRAAEASRTRSLTSSFPCAEKQPNGQNSATFYSPVSVASAFAMLCLGTKGNHTQILEGRKFNLRKMPDARIHQCSQRLLLTLLHPNRQLQGTVGSSLFVNESLKPVDQFVQDVKELCHAELISISFTDAQVARKQINNHVERETHGEIVDLVKNLEEGTALSLVNYISFHGSCHLEQRIGQDKCERQRGFTFIEGIKGRKRSVLCRECRLYRAQSGALRKKERNGRKINGRCFCVPHYDVRSRLSKRSLFDLVPEELTAALSDWWQESCTRSSWWIAVCKSTSKCARREPSWCPWSITWGDFPCSGAGGCPAGCWSSTTWVTPWPSSSCPTWGRCSSWSKVSPRSTLTPASDTSRYVNLLFPKLSISGTYDLKSLLGTLGITKVFSNAADLSGVTEEAPPKLSKAVHKAALTLDAERAEDIWMAELEPRVWSVVPTVSFNRPFLVIIKDELTKPLLFVGRVLDPTGQ
ncbi:LOW QUALITY PROTEIN: alpha-1-antitrypsin-like [Erethizon dorsatum]